MIWKVCLKCACLFRLATKLCRFTLIWVINSQIYCSTIRRLINWTQTDRNLWCGRSGQNLSDQKTSRFPYCKVTSYSEILKLNFMYVSCAIYNWKNFRHKVTQIYQPVVFFDAAKGNCFGEISSCFKDLARLVDPERYNSLFFVFNTIQIEQWF